MTAFHDSYRVSIPVSADIVITIGLTLLLDETPKEQI